MRNTKSTLRGLKATNIVLEILKLWGEKRDVLIAAFEASLARNMATTLSQVASTACRNSTLIQIATDIRNPHPSRQLNLPQAVLWSSPQTLVQN